MKCTICNEKLSKMYEEKDICFYCDSMYRAILVTVESIREFYKGKASRRVPDTLQELIKRMMYYKNNKPLQEGSEEWLMNDFD